MLGFGNKRQSPDERKLGNSLPNGSEAGIPRAESGARGSLPAGEEARFEAYMEKRAAEIDAQIREFSRKNPDFDIGRELKNPKFCNYLWVNGLSVEDAYYLTHREDGALFGRIKNAAADRRITENGTAKSGGSGIVKKNPEEMSDEEVDDIIRRVRKGEHISF